jgi:phage-related protein
MNFLKDLPGQLVKLSVDIIKGVASLVQKIAVWLLTDGLKMLINGVTSLVKSVGGALWDGVLAVVDFILDPVPVIQKAWEWGMGLISGIWDAIKGLPGFFWDLMTDAWTKIAEYWGFASPATKMIELGQGLIDGILSIFGDLPQKIKDIAVAAWNALTSAFSGIKEFAGNIITGFMQKFREIKDKIKDTIKAALGRVGRFLGISSPSKKMAEVGDNMGAGMVKGFSNVGEQMALEAKEALKRVAVVMVKGALEIGQIFARGITSAVGMIAGAMQSVATTLLNTFKFVFQSMVTLAKQNIMMVLVTIKGAFEMIASIIMNSGVLQAIEQVFTTFRSIFTGLADMVVEQIARVIQTVKMGFEMMTSILVSAREIVVGTVSAIFGAFTGIFTGITEIASTNLMKVIEVIHHGFKRMFQVFDMARDFILNSIEGIAKSMVRIFKFSIDSVVDIIAGGITTAIKTLRKAAGLIGDVMGVIKGMAEFGTYFAAIGSSINIFGPDPKDAAEDLKGFEQTFNQMTKTQQALLRLESTLDRSKDVEEDVAEKIATIVDAYNEGAEKLSNIAPINIDAVLAQVNDSLRVRRDKVTIEDNGVTINMSLNVTMMAEDVAKPLIESDLVLRGSSEKVAGLGVNT